MYTLMRTQKGLLRLGIILALAVITTLGVMAEDDEGNPNDPRENERANACYEGGVMEDKCDTNWEWTCGWYVIRYNYQMIGEEGVPETCESLITPPFSMQCSYIVEQQNDQFTININATWPPVEGQGTLIGIGEFEGQPTQMEQFAALSPGQGAFSFSGSYPVGDEGLIAVSMYIGDDAGDPLSPVVSCETSVPEIEVNNPLDFPD